MEVPAFDSQETTKVNNPHSTRDNNQYMRLVLCGQLAEMNFADGGGLVTEANSNQIADVYNRSFTFIATGQSGEGEKERSGSSSFFVYLPVSFSSVLRMSGGGVRRVDGLVVVVAGCCCSRGRLKMLLIAASVS